MEKGMLVDEAQTPVALEPTGPIGFLSCPYRGPEAYRTALQRHCAFFDPDGDGIMYPRQTLHQFRLLGYSWLMSLLGTFLVHFFLSFLTSDSWIPDLSFPIHLRNIHRCVHGSDTGTYNDDGTLNVSKIDLLVNRFDISSKGGLSFLEGWMMTEQLRDMYDPAGW